MKPSPPCTRSGYKIAIVGSGPAGLAAAAQLNKVGHLVTVYERNPHAGGLLRYGIPTMKLNREVIERRLNLMEKEGIVFKTNCSVGSDITVDELLNYDAILLAIGSTRPRDLPLKGRDLLGVHYAMNFLERSQKKLENRDFSSGEANEKNVLVIGGGDTGVDCIATSVRQGAKSVIMLEMFSQPPETRPVGNLWPQYPRTFRMEYGHYDAKAKFGKDPRQYNLLPKEFLDDGCGNVCGLQASEIKWKKNNTGRWEAEELTTEKNFKSDLILLALGFLGPENDLLEKLDVKLNLRCSIQTPKDQYHTCVPRIYAAGDCRIGQSLVVTAIAEGRQAARQIDEDLMNDSFLAGPGGVISHIHLADR